MDCDSTFPRLKLGRKQSISLGSWKPLTYSRNRKKTVTRICVVNGFPTNNVVNGRERTTTLFVHLFLRVLEAAIGGST